MPAPMKQLWFSLVVLASMATGCGTSKTVEQINGFADKICACQDAACATSVEAEYQAWWAKNQRARGSEGDRKDVEKAMERYSQCNFKLVGPEELPEAVKVPKVDLAPAPAPVPSPREAEISPKPQPAPRAEPTP